MITHGAVAAVKICPPDVDGAAIYRPRLLRSLDSVLQSNTRAAFITGALGFGKTTLAAQWASCETGRNALVAWLTIDPSDDKPARFWSLVAATLQGVHPRLQDGLSNGDPVPETCGDNAFIDGIITLIATINVPIVFILDDVHSLKNPDVLQDIDYFILRSPRNLKFILIGRSCPPLNSLYQLNLDDALIEIARESLAFSRKETVCLVNGSRLDVDTLLVATEGWPAAIKLAHRYASSPKGYQLSPDFRADPLCEKLMAPLFETYTPDIRELLLVVSVLGIFSAIDLDHALDRKDGIQMLTRLCAQTGMIYEVENRDGNAPLYRCHKLLQRYLDTQTVANPTPERAAIHKRMAAWLPGQARHGDALAHAAKAEDPEVLRGALSRSGFALLWRGETSHILALTENQGADSVNELVLLMGAIAMREGDPSRAAAWIEKVKDNHEHAGLPASFRALQVGVEAQVLMSQGLMQEAVQHLERKVPQGPRDDLDLFLINTLAAALIGVGRMEDARALASRGVLLANERRNLPALVDARIAAAAVNAAGEEFKAARAEAFGAIRCGDQSSLRYSPSLRPAHLIAAWCAYHALDDASARLHHAYVRKTQSAPPVVAQSASKLALILSFLASEHRHAAANELLDRIRFDLVHGAHPQDVAACSLQAASMMLQLRRGDSLEQLKSHLRQHQGVSGELHTITAWELIAGGHSASARKMLSAVTTGFVESQSRSTVLTAWTLTCKIDLEEERIYQARTALGKALELGADHGMLRAFAFAGPDVQAAVVREQAHYPSYRQAIARIARSRETASSSFRPPLTHRELDLLTLLPTFATVDEIAQSLLISPNTVKTHVRGIYRKLGAGSRRDAIAIAQGLGLLPAIAGAVLPEAAAFDGAVPTLTHRQGHLKICHPQEDAS